MRSYRSGGAASERDEAFGLCDCNHMRRVGVASK